MVVYLITWRVPERRALRNTGTEMTKTNWGHRQDLLGIFSLRSNAAAGPHVVLSLRLQEGKTDLKGTSFPEPFAALSSSPQKALRLCVLLARKKEGALQQKYLSV